MRAYQRSSTYQLYMPRFKPTRNGTLDLRHHRRTRLTIILPRRLNFISFIRVLNLFLLNAIQKIYQLHAFFLRGSYILIWSLYIQEEGARDRDFMVVGFTTTYAISAYHHWCCEFESTLSLSVICDRSVVFSGFSGFLHQ